MRIVEFFTTIRRTILLDARIYLANQSQLATTLDGLKKQLLEANLRASDDANAKVEVDQIKEKLNDYDSYLKR